jgi:DNA-binding XRE family transcriptional regulator
MGDHIRAWRIDNKLLQADVAKRLGVCEDTIAG